MSIFCPCSDWWSSGGAEEGYSKHTGGSQDHSSLHPSSQTCTFIQNEEANWETGSWSETWSRAHWSGSAPEILREDGRTPRKVDCPCSTQVHLENFLERLACDLMNSHQIWSEMAWNVHQQAPRDPENQVLIKDLNTKNAIIHLSNWKQYTSWTHQQKNTKDKTDSTLMRLINEAAYFSSISTLICLTGSLIILIWIAWL